jgi:diguanylate cyclase (GGDEF)-like protein
MIDIDHFKRLNDSYGHQAGDDVLREMGALIRQEIRATDVPGRYGGEEFCILLSQTPLEGARDFALRFRVAVESACFPAQGKSLKITASLGVSSCSESGVSAAEDLIRRADEALYQAKTAGRNRVVVREP